MKRVDTNLTCPWMASLLIPSTCPFLIVFIAPYQMIVRRVVLPALKTGRLVYLQQNPEVRTLLL
jgi:hypothetical protein